MWKFLLLLSFYAVSCVEIGDLKADSIIKLYSTTTKNTGFELKQSGFNSTKDVSASILTINTAKKHQTILGFGGTISDATAFNLNKLQKDVRAEALEALFGESGIGINIARIPIGGTEFSSRNYTLDDHPGDVSLTKFSLQYEDLFQKIPIIKKALQLRNGNLKLFASSWTAPLWMKTHNIWAGYSMLKEEYGRVYAEYLKKALDAYEEHGIKWWGVTTGTFPMNGLRNSVINGMGWIPQLQVKWIKNHFGPIIRNSTHKNVKIIGHDGKMLGFSYYVPVYARDSEVLEYIDGLATDWWTGDVVDPAVVEFAKNDHKELFLLAININYQDVNPILGNWKKAFKTLGQLFDRMEYNYVGWADYNLVLNTTGGPSHANIQADAPIIVSDDGKSFVKTPAYYVLGHFSKFVIPGSVRVDVAAAPAKRGVYTVAFVRPDKMKVVIVYNENLVSAKVQLSEEGKFSQVIEIPGQSLHTLVFP